MTFTVFSKMAACILLVCLLAVSCNGVPVGEDSSDSTNEVNTETTSAISVSPEVEGHSMDDILPGTKVPPVVVTFVDVPRHTETELGASVLLACRTSNPVAECQWSWQPLPPVHLPLPDISDSPNVTSTTVVVSTVTASSTPSTHSLPVRQFAAFGNNSNDCSVRFSSTKYEQTGYWTCAARSSTADPFTSTEPAKLSIITEDQGLLITFAKQDNVVEVPSDSSAQIMCQTKSPVRECQWSWRQLNQSQPWNLEVKRFPAFGNDSTECSIKFKNVLPEQEGLWTCGARINPNSSFTQSTPIRFLISDVDFVQLSRGVQVAAGESVLLRCLVNKPVVQCEWSWRATNSSKDPLLVKKFLPNKDSDHDCSVRFKNILYEEEGLWTCGVRLTTNGILHEAQPATVSLLPTAKVSFVDMPVDTSVPVGTEATLKCVTSSRVEKCTWSYKSLSGNDPEIVVRDYPSNGDLGRDCTLHLPQVYPEDQGQWSCQVSITSLSTMLTSPFIKLTVFEQDEIKFSELSQDIQISSGGTVLLRCVTSSTVEQCRWSLTPVNSNTTVVVKQFPAAGSEGRDCSVRLSHALAEQEGLWTCGARIRGKQNYTDAPPAKLSLLEPELVTVATWAVPHQKVTLACKAGPVTPDVECHWLHPPNIHVQQNSTNSSRKSRQVVQMDYKTGICTLIFKPEQTDLGQWTCKFILKNENGDVELGNASVILLSTLSDEKLGWIVGALTAVVLLLMIIVVVLVVCKTKLFIKKNPSVFETSNKKKDANSCNDGYSQNSKINYTFTDESNSQAISSVSNVLPNRSPNLYERSSKCHAPPKVYENGIELTLNLL
ncbi:uncharacterized protein [Prorops nasuta]|uniref:uncharacterized protein isoform X2 n=1 Tax=Prorops nasuta TaxID=863751 RepID=UPI0034CD181E